MFADFHGANTPTSADFDQRSLTTGWEEGNTVVQAALSLFRRTTTPRPIFVIVVYHSCC